MFQRPSHQLSTRREYLRSYGDIDSDDDILYSRIRTPRCPKSLFIRKGALHCTVFLSKAIKDWENIMSGKGSGGWSNSYYYGSLGNGDVASGQPYDQPSSQANQNTSAHSYGIYSTYDI